MFYNFLFVKSVFCELNGVMVFGGRRIGDVLALNLIFKFIFLFFFVNRKMAFIFGLLFIIFCCIDVFVFRYEINLCDGGLVM